VKKLFNIFIPIIFLTLIGVVSYLIFFAPVGSSKEIEVFVIPENKENFDIVKTLKEKKFIKNTSAFKFLIDNFSYGKGMESGGYRLSQNMNAWQVMKKISGKPDLVWFKQTHCVRKEQLGEYLAETLNWNGTELNSWNSLYKNDKPDYFEGVYYPDTYLIPLDETPAQVAQRFINRFNEKFAPLAEGFASKNIKWTTGVKIASLISREAAGIEDMKLISGIIWNRLDTEMPLQIDATMQYTLGKKANGSWWGGIDLTQKQSDSPYNSYLYKGLPPTPICNPNIDAIEAALYPEETDCLFYLHDSDKQIHCAKTYKEHLANIEKYLR
jgi:UPF0755 protein